MNAVSPLSFGAASQIYARRGGDPPPATAAAGKTDAVARGPAVVLGGSLTAVAPVGGPDAIGGTAGVTPVPPVKPVVYRPGATVSFSV